LRVAKRTDRNQRVRPRFWRPWTIAVICLLVGLCLGWLLTAWSVPSSASTRLLAGLADPSLALRAARLRAALPQIQVNVDFEGHQTLSQIPQSTADSGRTCVPVEIDRDGAPVAARMCPLRLSRPDGGTELPVMRLDIDEDPSLYGVQSAVLSPATPDAALALEYLRAVRSAGIPAPHFVVLRLSVNGTSWGLYAMEELVAAETVTAGWETPGDVVVAFEPSSARVSPNVPGSAFARARPVVGPQSSDGTDGPSVVPTSETGAEPAPVARLRGTLTGDVRLSSLLDPDLYGEYQALTALWRGVLTPDWSATQFVYDVETDSFQLLATARTQAAALPLPAQMLDDPMIQRAVVRAIRDAGDPETIDARLADGSLDAMYAALGGSTRGEGSVRGILEANRSAMAAMIEPRETVRALLADDDGHLHLVLEAIQPYPVEIVGLELGEQGEVACQRAWATESAPGVALVAVPEIVIRARVTDVPVVARLRVPLDKLPASISAVGAEISVITRVWGLVAPVLVPATAGELGNGYGGD